MGVAKKLYRATVAKNNNRPSLNNKKSTQRQIKGELRLPFVLSVIPEFTLMTVGAGLPANAVDH